MSVEGILAAMLLASGPALAACGAAPATVVDWGLHRQWAVQRDCAHPERPARLVEVPWSAARAEQTERRVKDAGTARSAAARPAVRAGMRVTVAGEGDDATIHLVGMALEAGGIGDAIRVQAGWGRATLPCIVRGPAQVEMIPAKGRH